MILGLSAAPITLHEIDLMGAQLDIREAVAASATGLKVNESLETLASLLTALALELDRALTASGLSHVNGRSISELQAALRTISGSASN